MIRQISVFATSLLMVGSFLRPSNAGIVYYGYIPCNDAAPIFLHASGTLKSCYLAQFTMLGYVPCRVAQIDLYPSGNLQRCYLDKKTQFGNITCKEGQRVSLDERRNLLECSGTSKSSSNSSKHDGQNQST